MRNISSESLNRNFIQRGENAFEVKETIRNYVTFSTQDLLKPLPMLNIDLILCRNFLIYISKDHQRIVINNLIKILNPQGFLILGKTEGFPLLNAKLFLPENLKEHIYQYAGNSAEFV
jgi:two-component system CheB/CheR fusion protein